MSDFAERHSPNFDVAAEASDFSLPYARIGFANRKGREVVYDIWHNKAKPYVTPSMRDPVGHLVASFTLLRQPREEDLASDAELWESFERDFNTEEPTSMLNASDAADEAAQRAAARARHPGTTGIVPTMPEGVVENPEL